MKTIPDEVPMQLDCSRKASDLSKPVEESGVFVERIKRC